MPRYLDPEKNISESLDQEGLGVIATDDSDRTLLHLSLEMGFEHMVGPASVE